MATLFLLTACAFFLLPDPWSPTPVKTAWAGVEERLAKLEEGQRQLELRMNDLRSEMNARFDETNRRIDDLGNGLGKRIDETRSEMRWLLGFLILLGLVPVVSRFFEKRTDRTEAESLKAEMHALKDRLSRVEASANPGAKT